MSKEDVNTAVLYQLLNEEIKAFVSSRVANPADAEDLVQEVFVKVHNGLGQVDDDSRIRAWVYQIARNSVIDFYRKNGKPSVELEEELLEDKSSYDQNVNEIVIQWFPTVIAALPEKYRRAVELYELQGMSQQNIAAELGLSLSGAKSRIQRGRDQMRQMLFNCCTFEKDSSGNIVDYVRKPGGECAWGEC